MVSSNVIPPEPAEDENWYEDDPTLQALLASYVQDDVFQEAEPKLSSMGGLAPSKLDAWARTADRHDPELHRRSPTGERVDRVEFHPAYHELQRAAREHAAFNLAWHPLGDAERAPRTVALGLGYLYAQAESGYYCPACMTDGAAFVLDRHAPGELAERFVPDLVTMDPERGIEGAMYLTEKGGGSDVGGATQTVAEQAEDGTWRLTGEKWFASNCVADVAMALARMPDADGDGGTSELGLFLVPRDLPDGSRNPGLRIERLKDKLGVASMPTGEVVLERAHAHLVQPAPEGFKAMTEMVNLSRLYNAVASVAVARRALREGQRAGRTRESFGKQLREHPLFLRDLVELTVDIEGALAFTIDTADVFDAWADGADEVRPVLRMLTPCAKAATAKLAVRAASEGCELLGGAGYIEEYVTPRLLRDAQVLPIWEGTTNIQGLDFLRALTRERALDAFVGHVEDRLDPAVRQGELVDTVEAVETGLAGLQESAARLMKADRGEAEAISLDLLERAYHAHATALLARLSAHRADDERSRVVARLYAARHLADERSAAREAIREALDEHGQALAYPDETGD